MTAGPPRLAQWLLRQTLPPERYETVAGALQPDVQTMTIVRHGLVGCGASGCVLVLMRPEDTPRPNEPRIAQ